MIDGKCVRSAIFYIFFSVIFIPCLGAQGIDRLYKFADNVYARIASPNGNAVGNAGIILLENSVLVFDTHFTPESGYELLDAIRSITTKPVRYIVNSHFHPDHTHGNQVFGDAFIIGSRGTRRNILQNDLPSLDRTISVVTSQLEQMQKEVAAEKDPEKFDALEERILTQTDYLETLQHLRIQAPFIVLDEYLSISEGAGEVIIKYMGTGHTDSDTILLVPSEKIVFCGSLFFNHAIPNVQDASLLKWMDVLPHMLELDADIYVPGHGPPGNVSDVQEFIGYLNDLKALVKPYILRGILPEQAMQEIQLPEKYARYRFKNLFPANIEKMYGEVKEELLLSIPIEGPQRPKN